MDVRSEHGPELLNLPAEPVSVVPGGVTDDAIEADALGLTVEFEALGRTWYSRPSSKVKSLRVTRYLADGLLFEALTEFIGEDQAEAAEDLIVGDQLREFFDALTTATGFGSLGESSASRNSSRSRRRR